MKSISLFFSVFCINTLLCVGVPRYRQSEGCKHRRTHYNCGATRRTRVVTERCWYINEKADRMAQAFAMYGIAVYKPREFKKSYEEAYGEVIKDEFKNALNKVIKGISIIYLFPNEWEFSVVYENLKEIGAKDVENEIFLQSVKKRLYPQNLGNSMLNVVELNGKIFCMATCGEANKVASFCENLFSVFKKLKTVFLGGICGCLNTEVDVGSVLVANNYNYIPKMSIGDLKDRQVQSLDEEAAMQVGNVYVYKKDVIQTSMDEFPLGEDFETILRRNKINILHGVNYSLGAFIDSKDFASSIAKLGGEGDNSNAFFNMEDGQIADQCRRKKCNFYSFRVVSDHAGFIAREIEEGGKKIACQNLGKFFALFMWFLSLEDRKNENLIVETRKKCLQLFY